MTQITVQKEADRVFVAAHNMIVDVHVTEDGIAVQITKGNDVVAEAYADAA